MQMFLRTLPKTSLADRRFQTTVFAQVYLEARLTDASGLSRQNAILGRSAFDDVDLSGWLFPVELETILSVKMSFTSPKPR